MAVPVIESSTTNSANAISLTATKPTGVASGDLLVILSIRYNTGSHNQLRCDNDSNLFSEGFFGGFHGANSSTDAHVDVAYKISDGTESSSFTLQYEQASPTRIWYLRISGADQDWPITIHNFRTLATSSTSIVVPEVTTDFDDSLGFTLWSCNDDTGDPFTVSGTGWTKQAEGDFNASPGVSGGYATKSVSTAGGSGSCTVSSSSTLEWTGLQFAVNPTATAGAYPALQDFTQNDTNGSTASSITLTKPSGVATDDCLVIIVGSDDNQNGDRWSTPTGFTKINEAGNSTSDCHVAAFYRIADGTEGSTINVSHTSSDELWGYYFRLDNVDTTTPLDQVGSDFNSGTAAGHDVTGVTTSNANSLVILCNAFDGGDGLPYTTQEDDWLSALQARSGTGGSDASGGIYFKLMPSAGASGNCLIQSRIGDGLAAFQFNLNAASGATTHPATASFAATSTFTADRTKTSNRTATFAATSSLTAVGTKRKPATASFAATSTFTAVAEKKKIATASFAATSTFTAAANKISPRTATFAATSAFTADHAKVARRTSAFAATSSFTATGTKLKPVTASFAATSSYTATATVVRRRTAAFNATSAFTAVARQIHAATSTFAATSTLTANRTAVRRRTASFDATSSFTATGVKTGVIAATASFAATSSYTATATVVRRRTATFAATSSLTALGTKRKPATATFAATSTFTAVGEKKKIATATFAATSSFTAVGIRVPGTAPAPTPVLTGGAGDWWDEYVVHDATAQFQCKRARLITRPVLRKAPRPAIPTPLQDMGLPAPVPVRRLEPVDLSPPPAPTIDRRGIRRRRDEQDLAAVLAALE